MKRAHRGKCVIFAMTCWLNTWPATAQHSSLSLSVEGNDLRTQAGQNRFLKSVQSRSDPTHQALRDLILVLRDAPVGKAPASSIEFLLDPSLKVKGVVPVPSIDFRQLSSLKLSNMQRQEVEPDRGADMAGTRLAGLQGGSEISQQQATDLMASLHAPAEKRRAKSCGDAVRSLRQKINFGSLPPSDRINDFTDICLFAFPRDASPARLTEEQRRAAGLCAAAYNDYKKFCFDEGRLQNAASLLKKLTGIIVVRDAAVSARQRIICSGMLVGKYTVLSARHCLGEVPTNAAPGSGVWFVPLDDGLPNPVALPVAEILSAPNFEPKSTAVAAASFAPSMSSPNTDVAIFKLAAPVSVNLSFPLLRKPAVIENVVLGGFQRLIANAMLLQARLTDNPLFDDDDLIRTGAWRLAFAFDASPTCLVMPFKSDEAASFGFDKSAVYGHICQSLYSASGSVLVSTSQPTNVAAVAVHISASSDSVLAATDLPVESVRPRNFAVITSDGLKTKIEAIR
ncbi:trypsin-like serine protease [uncultured Bradyrhizobium sp.]|uniref:trypsin-like serine protease n=1 Tax=uncultured Bradyrhizobium sp. TaxID=199684 RepID=UPI0035C9B510